jgi:hypothetical protein
MRSCHLQQFGWNWLLSKIRQTQKDRYTTPFSFLKSKRMKAIEKWSLETGSGRRVRIMERN